MKEEWLFPGAVIPVDVETTAALVAEIKRLIDVVGGMALAQPEQEPVECMCGICKLGHQRKPLTDEEVIKLKMEGRDLEFVNMTALHRFARAIEDSHGIKETKE